MRFLYIMIAISLCLANIGCNTGSSKEAPSDQPHFEANWESLKQYQIPEWFNDAKLGIFIHWGPYSVPAFGSEWYGRRMYMDTATFSAQLKHQKDGPNFTFVHHKEKWGDPKEFGYKDFIPDLTYNPVVVIF